MVQIITMIILLEMSVETDWRRNLCDSNWKEEIYHNDNKCKYSKLTYITATINVNRKLIYHNDGSCKGEINLRFTFVPKSMGKQETWSIKILSQLQTVSAYTEDRQKRHTARVRRVSEHQNIWSNVNKIKKRKTLTKLTEQRVHETNLRRQN